MNKQSVSDITPELRKDLIIRKSPDDDHWYIFDPVSEKYFAIGKREYEIIRLFSKDTTLFNIENSTSIGGGINPVELAEIINFLRQKKLLLRSSANLEAESQYIKKNRVKQLFKNYLYINIPLWSPDPFISYTAKWVKRIFNPIVTFIIIFIAIIGYIMLIPNASRYQDEFILSLSFQHVTAYIILIPFIKIFHEFAHAYAAKFNGIHIRKMGLAFVMFMPRIYTDLTDAWQLKRTQRFFTAAAGIIFELIVGGIAVLIWSNTAEGVVHSISFYLFTISIINTLIFNGNPFMRFDGYYMLSDFLGIKNLQQKSMALLRMKIYNYIFGIKLNRMNGGIVLEENAKQQKIMLTYAIGVFFYRFFLYGSIISIIYLRFFKLLGVILACLGVYSLFIKPIIREVKLIYMNKTQGNKFRIIGVSFAIIILFGALLFTPLPFNDIFPCQFLALHKQVLYVNTPGILKKINIKNGARVSKNSIITTLENPLLTLEYEHAKNEYKIGKLELNNISFNQKTSSQTVISEKRLESLKAICNVKRSAIEQLTIKSVIDGIFVRYNDLEKDKWLKQGETFGEIVSPKEVVVHIFIEYQMIQNIKVGDRFYVYAKNSLKKIPVTIKQINKEPIRSSLDPKIKLLLEKENKFKKKQFYKIITTPILTNDPYLIGRTGYAQKKVYKSIASIISKHIFIFFHSEF